MTHRATKDAPQHIPSPLVAGEHAIGQKKCDSARMICEHAESGGIHLVRNDLVPSAARNPDAASRLVALTSPIRKADYFFDGLDQRREDIGVKIVHHTLLHAGDALQSRAGVD